MQYRIFPYFFLDLMSLAPHFPFTGLWEPGNFIGYVWFTGLLELGARSASPNRACCYRIFLHHFARYPKRNILFKYARWSSYMGDVAAEESNQVRGILDAGRLRQQGSRSSACRNLSLTASLQGFVRVLPCGRRCVLKRGYHSWGQVTRPGADLSWQWVHIKLCSTR